MSEEVSQDGLVKGVFYEADYIIDVRGLDSGGSRDVHGQVHVEDTPWMYARKAKVESVELTSDLFLSLKKYVSFQCCMDLDT